MLVSVVQQSESDIYIYIYRYIYIQIYIYIYIYIYTSPLFCISFPFRSPQSTEQGFFCYRVGSHWALIPWRRKWQPTLVFLPGEFCGQRSLVGYSPWRRIELNMIDRLTLIELSSLYTASIVCICQSQSPNSSHPALPPIGVHMFVLRVCVSIFVCK